MINIFKDCNAPTTCPICGSKLQIVGCDLLCINESCPAKEFKSVVSLLRGIDIEYAAEKSLGNWGINTFDDLLKFRPDDSVMQNKFYKQLLDKLFVASELTILQHVRWDGLNAKSISKIINYYGMDAIKFGNYNNVNMPMGIGPTLLSKFESLRNYNINILNKITSDSRYKKPVKTKPLKKNILNKGNVCFTGKLETMTRSQAEAKAQSMGWEIGSVNKNLTVLVCNDSSSTSSKMTKAKKLGIKIMTEEEFFN